MIAVLLGETNVVAAHLLPVFGPMGNPTGQTWLPVLEVEHCKTEALFLQVTKAVPNIAVVGALQNHM